ncbi:MAG: type II toxin-antitoxin system VapC family toxin [Thermoanaerobaculia bacterium]|nr:type II toxin-antitoxin system VapC family toxin [Thermoanaerobaculia bacterium]
MRYLLDTNVCIAYLNGVGPIARRLLALPKGSAAVSALTEGELQFGAERSGRVEENRGRVETFLQEIDVVPFDRLAARQFGLLKARLLAMGSPIPDFDIGIASSALCRGLVLVSADRQMRQIPDLLVEDWRR